MTTVTIITDKEGAYKEVVCMGHAGYAKKGEPDILCAAISVLVESTVNSLTELAGEVVETILNEETGFMRIIFSEDTPLQSHSVFMLDSLVFSLENISKQYGKKYLQVNYKEV